MSRTARGLQQQRDHLNDANARGVKVFKVTGRVQVIGSGETSINVTFPVTFAERPGFSFGGELAENQIPTAGHLPTVNAVVASWTKIEKVTGIYHYTGAVMTFVVSHNPNYCWVHWHMEGKAFQNPINNLDGSDTLPT